MKRFVLVACFLAGSLLHGQAALPLDPALGVATIPLYDGAASEAGSKSANDAPTLTVFLPQPGRGNRSAVIVAPGGAYVGLASNLEGRQVADWFTARGFTAFVLKYRLGPQNLYPVPLLDAQRAIRLVRSRADKYSIAPDRIGMIGFSAGGHLAAEVATSYDQAPQPGSPADVVSGVSARPDFLVLGYPWLNAMQPALGKEINYCSMIHNLTAEQCKDFATRYTPSLHVTARTPTTFIYSTTDDAVVPVRASIDFYNAMLKVGAPVELHIFRHGPHGSGLGLGDGALDLWPMLLEQWLRDLGLMKATATAP